MPIQKTFTLFLKQEKEVGFTTGTQMLKKESMQWKHPGSPPSKKLRTQSSVGKVGFFATSMGYIDRLQACWYFNYRRYYASVIIQVRIERANLLAPLYVMFSHVVCLV